MDNWINKLASAIENDIVAGLRGYHSTMSLPIEQIEDEIILQRLLIIKEYQLKGILPINDLMLSINCIPVDCKNIERCSCTQFGTPTTHFEIPQIVLDYGTAAISYIGSIDRQNPYIFYISSSLWNYYHKYKRRGKNKPFVYIDITPNEHGMLDCFVFNAPFLKQISISAIFKDPRQLCNFKSCESQLSDDNINWLSAEIQRRIVEQKVRYYRQLATTVLPNNQEPAVG